MPQMPKFEKAPPELVERFRAVVDGVSVPGTTRRLMFGYPCAFVNGNMATGLFAAAWFARLSPPDVEELSAAGLARPFEPMPGRGMRGYSLLPDEIVADPGALPRWVERSLAFTATLPPKR